jgi:hypothetical protein
MYHPRTFPTEPPIEAKRQESFVELNPNKKVFPCPANAHKSHHWGIHILNSLSFFSAQNQFTFDRFATTPTHS